MEMVSWTFGYLSLGSRNHRLVSFVSFSLWELECFWLEGLWMLGVWVGMDVFV